LQTHRIAAYLYGLVSLGIIAFQLALAAGAPWGEFAMGGAYPVSSRRSCASRLWYKP
jgi:hypothetical protein